MLVSQEIGQVSILEQDAFAYSLSIHSLVSKWDVSGKITKKSQFY